MTFEKYFLAQLKRIKKQFLLTLGFFGILAIILIIGAAGFLKRSDEKNKLVISIGVVGENDTPIISGLLEVLEKFDDIGYTLNFTSMTKEEAEEAFMNEKLSAYCIIPEGFEEALSYDLPNDTIKFIKREGSYGLDDLYFSDLLPKVSDLVGDVNSAVYGFKDAYEDIKGTYDPKDVNDLFLEYVDHFLSRSELVDIEDLTKENSIGETGTLILGISLVFVFLFALTASPFFIDRKTDFLVVAKSNGLGEEKQVLAEFLAFGVYAVFLTVFVTLLIKTAGLLNLIMVNISFSLVMVLFIICLMIFSMQFFLYELLNGTIAKILGQFFIYIFMTYVSGYFYPAKYFPSSIKRLGEILPSGVSLKAYTAAFCEKIDFKNTGFVILYSVAFLLLTVLIRRTKLKKEFS